MLPPELTKLRTAIGKDPTKISVQRELLAELDKLDRFLSSVPSASSTLEIRTKMVNEGLLEIRAAYNAVTSGPGNVCQCCGRSL